MAEVLNFNQNDTQITLALNGDESNLLTFDPGDINLSNNFYKISQQIKTKERELYILFDYLSISSQKVFIHLSK